MKQRELTLFIGIVFCLSASVLFGALSYYSVWLEPLDGFAVFGWRVVGTVVLMLLALGITNQGRAFRNVVNEVIHAPRSLLLVVACSALMSIQVWLFGWAPLNGHAQDLAMGYFLMPLTMVLTGRVLFNEGLSRLQSLAVALALIGVGAELVRHGGVSLVSLVVMLGYPPYFILKRRLNLGALHSMMLEHLMMLPFGIAILYQKNWNWAFFELHSAGSWAIIAGLGMLGCMALLCFIAASQRMPLSLFGMLSYVEPLLLFLVAIALGESFSGADFITYLPIWLAVGCVMLNGWVVYQKNSAAFATKSSVAPVQ